MNLMSFRLQRAHRPVVVIDPSKGYRDALTDLLQAEKMTVEAFASVAEATRRGHIVRDAGCLLLNVDLPEVSGIEFQDRLCASGACTPIIFVADYADVNTSVRAMKAGAVDFLCKPFSEESLLEAVYAALNVGRLRRSLDREQANLVERYATLTVRQKEIMGLVVFGLMNKQIAHRVGLSEITVKVHRGHLMRKMDARSVAELVHMAHALRDNFEGPTSRWNASSQSDYCLNAGMAAVTADEVGCATTDLYAPQRGIVEEQWRVAGRNRR